MEELRFKSGSLVVTNQIYFDSYAAKTIYPGAVGIVLRSMMKPYEDAERDCTDSLGYPAIEVQFLETGGCHQAHQRFFNPLYEAEAGKQDEA